METRTMMRIPLLLRSVPCAKPTFLCGGSILEKGPSDFKPSINLLSQLVPSAGPARNNTRTYHSSARSFRPARRRRGGIAQLEEYSSSNKNDSDNDSETERRRGVGLQHPSVQDVSHFRQAANDLLDKLERALEPMKAKNDYFVVERSDGEIGKVLKLDLGPKLGYYEIEFSEDECIFQYSSPISGQILYCLSSITGEWVGCDDGHLFEGIFVRDLIRQCQGLPDL